MRHRLIGSMLVCLFSASIFAARFSAGSAILRVNESGWGLSHYDVLPDRVIAYLWRQAGSLKFSFKFKPRYGVKAQTAPSTLYDYYNPEARVALAPSRFIVK